LVIDFDMFVQLGGIIRRQLEVIVPRDVNESLRADGAFEVEVNLRFRQDVVFGIKAFHVISLIVYRVSSNLTIKTWKLFSAQLPLVIP
jgi:hypothetical protein